MHPVLLVSLFAMAVWIGITGRRSEACRRVGFALLVFLGACGDDKSSGLAEIFIRPRLATLSITMSPNVLAIGGSTVAVATGKDPNGTAVAVTNVRWSTSNASVATVNTDGIVTGVGSGIATITATADSVSGSAIVNVGDSPPSGPQLLLVFAKGTITVGESTSGVVKTIADLYQVPIANSKVTWASSAPTIAMVSDSGIVTGMSAGAARISATYEGQTSSSPIVVQWP